VKSAQELRLNIHCKSVGVNLTPGNLVEYRFGPNTFHAFGLSETDVKHIHEAYSTGELHAYMDRVSNHAFLLIIHDTEHEKLLVINDKFCTNEIFYHQTGNELYVSDDLRTLLTTAKLEPVIEPTSAYEMLFFYTVCPPRTIYKDVSALPMATVLEYCYGTSASNEVSVIRYWDLETRLGNKLTDYDKIVSSARGALRSHIAANVTDKIGVSLSGGIDSGGLLAMVTDVVGRRVPSISLGPRGPESGDLISARKTIEEIGTDNIEVYPRKQDLAKLPRYMEGLNQPLAAEYVFSNSLIFDAAEKLSIDKLVNGSGVQMLLGNLPLSRLAYYTSWFDSYVPRFVYRLLVKLKHFTLNQQQLLPARTWQRRFMHTIGPRIADHAAYYTKFDARVLADIEHSIDICEGDLLDQIAYMYTTRWVNYLQYRDYSALAKKRTSKIFIPFDCSAVAEVLFGTPNKYRKQNKWNKQVIRDIFKPYVSERLYNARPKSLVIPFDNWFMNDHERFVAYLKQSPLVASLVDLDSFEHDFAQLNESGLTLLRMLGLAVWYDVNHNPEQVGKYEALFARGAGGGSKAED